MEQEQFIEEVKAAVRKAIAEKHRFVRGSTNLELSDEGLLAAMPHIGHCAAGWWASGKTPRQFAEANPMVMSLALGFDHIGTLPTAGPIWWAGNDLAREVEKAGLMD